MTTLLAGSFGFAIPGLVIVFLPALLSLKMLGVRLRLFPSLAGFLLALVGLTFYLSAKGLDQYLHTLNGHLYLVEYIAAVIGIVATHGVSKRESA